MTLWFRCRHKHLNYWRWIIKTTKSKNKKMSSGLDGFIYQSWAGWAGWSWYVWLARWSGLGLCQGIRLTNHGGWWMNGDHRVSASRFPPSVALRVVKWLRSTHFRYSSITQKGGKGRLTGWNDWEPSKIEGAGRVVLRRIVAVDPRLLSVCDRCPRISCQEFNISDWWSLPFRPTGVSPAKTES